MKKSMASTNLLSLFFPFLFFLASADGRSLHKADTSRKIDFLRRFSSNDINVTKGVSLASDSSYTGKTNYNDVLGLAALITYYPWLEEANDDPCVAPKWSWIVCNSDANPRIIALELSAKLLVAPVPDFSSMDALQKIDLSSNSIYGAIPSFLSTFPNLQELNLDYNYFTGQVPNSLACNKNLKLSINGNTNLYTSSSCSGSTNNNPSPPANRNSNNNDRSFSTTPVATTSRKKKSNAPAVIGSIAGVFAFIGIAVGIFAIYNHKARTAAAIAEASLPAGTNIDKGNVPIEEMPMNTRCNNMSP